MSAFYRKRSTRQAVKEALDNLPAGICFFDESGLLILCNRQMQRLSYAISGRDLQIQSEMEAWLDSPSESGFTKKAGEVFELGDGTAWQFDRRRITCDGGTECTEFIASDVTELYRSKRRLEDRIEEQRRVLMSIENISHNIAGIVRNEEALKLKMKIHNDLGAALGFACRYLSDGCPLEEKAAFIAQQKEMSRVLLDESHGEEDNDPLKDLYQVAGSLGMKIEMEGGKNLNGDARRLLSYAIRECLTNTVRHAGGDTVFVKLSTDENRLYCELTNNGSPPEDEIKEGGGLSSLREKMRRCGGTMRIRSLPRFLMEIALPLDLRDE